LLIAGSTPSAIETAKPAIARRAVMVRAAEAVGGHRLSPATQVLQPLNAAIDASILRQAVGAAAARCVHHAVEAHGAAPARLRRASNDGPGVAPEEPDPAMPPVDPA
jgi:hypothetical protein